MRSFGKLLLIVIAAVQFIVGCAGQQAGRRYFYPPLPNDPKLEYIGIYSGTQDFGAKENPLFESLAGKTLSQFFKKPVGVASDGKGVVYVTDPNQAALIAYDFNKKKISTVGKEGLLITPFGVTVDEEGRVYVSDTQRNEVYVFDKNHNPLFSFGKETVNWPTGIAVNDKKNLIYVVNSHGHNITVYSLAGEYLYTIGKRGRGEGSFNYPLALTLNSREEIIVADSINALIQIFSPEGKFLYQFGKRGDGHMNFELIKGVAVDSEDNIYVSDSKANKVLIFSRLGKELLRFDGRFFVPPGEEGPIHGGFVLPTGIDIDNDDRIYLADSWNRRFHIYQYLNKKRSSAALQMLRNKIDSLP